MFWFVCPCCQHERCLPDAARGQPVNCPYTGQALRIARGTPYTERDWLGEQRVSWLVTCAQGTASPRQVRRFACACCRHFEDRWYGWLAGRNYVEALEVSARYADGEATLGELSQAQEALGTRVHPWWRTPSAAVRTAIHHAVATKVDLQSMLTCLRNALGQSDEGFAEDALCELGRDIFGNPFRPVAFDPAWARANDGAARKVAEEVHATGRYGDLPVLADALEDAGCADEPLLAHCRGGGRHARGCWAVSAVRGKG